MVLKKGKSNVSFYKKLFLNKKGQLTPQQRAQRKYAEEQALAALKKAAEDAQKKADEIKEKGKSGVLADRMESRWNKIKKGAAKPSKGITRVIKYPKKVVGDVGSGTVKILRGDWGEVGGPGGWMFIFMTVLLWAIDILVIRFDGINMQRFIDNFAFTSIGSYIGWFFNSIVITLLVAYYVLNRESIHQRPQEFISWFLIAETISLIIFLGGGGTMLIHLAFVIAIYFLFIKPTDRAADKTAANITFFVLLAFDFFGYGLISYFINDPIIANRFVIPIWFYYALIYTQNKDRSFWINALIVLVILINIFYFIGGIQGLRGMTDVLTPDEKQEAIGFWRTGWKNVKETFSKLKTNLVKEFDERLDYASGGYYKGKVERNKIGPLGVFIEEVKSIQPHYYPNEEVIIYGKVKAISLDDFVRVSLGCHLEDKLTPKGEIISDNPLDVYSYETRDFECRILSKDLDTGLGGIGLYSMTIDAEFEFETLGYLKTYFMDIERKRGMVREGLDPFKEFNIQDKNPVGIYTDGPISVGMEMTSPLIEVSSDNTKIIQPRLGITLENIEGWEGVIKNVTQLVFMTPKGTKIEEGSCSFTFKDYTKEMCDSDCDKRCKDRCKNTGFTNCESNCKTTCNEDCTLLFDDEYKGYMVDIDKMNKNLKDIFKDIDRFRSFSCRVTVESDVLGQNPISVRYFRTKARYNYKLSEDIPIVIQKDPTEETPDGKKIDDKGVVELKAYVPGNLADKIKDHANTIGVPEDLALGLAWTESRHRHCCQSSSRNTGANCVGTKEVTCDIESLIESYDGSSLGIMQLNTKAHCGWFYPDKICENGFPKEDVEYYKYGCDESKYYKTVSQDCKLYKQANCYGQSATNVDCNIKLGLLYLKSLYSTEKKLYECNNKYYKEWDRALRGYIGWGCPDEASINYVETVHDEIDKKTWEELSTAQTSNLKIISLSHQNIEVGDNLVIDIETSSNCNDIKEYVVYLVSNNNKNEIERFQCNDGETEYRDGHTITLTGTYTIVAEGLNDKGNEIERIESYEVIVKGPNTIVKIHVPEELYEKDEIIRAYKINLRLETTGDCSKIKEYVIYREKELGNVQKILNVQCENEKVNYEKEDMVNQEGTYNYIVKANTIYNEFAEEVKSGEIVVGDTGGLV